MQRFSATLSRLAFGLVLLGSVGMIVSMLLGVADVVGTKFLDWPVPGTLEITESTMVLIVFGALAYTQERRGHIRVEILLRPHGSAGKVVHGRGHARRRVRVLRAARLAGHRRAALQLGDPRSDHGHDPLPALSRARFCSSPAPRCCSLQLALDIIADLGRMWRGEPPPAPIARAGRHRESRARAPDACRCCPRRSPATSSWAC